VALGPYLGRAVYAGASPRARVCDVRGRAAVSSASGMTVTEAGPAPPPVGPEWASVSARRGLSGISAAALDGIGGGGVATRMRGGVEDGVVRNGWAPLAMARTSARVRNEPDGGAGSAAPQNHSHTHSALAAGRRVEVAGREGGSKPSNWPLSNKNGRCARAAVVEMQPCGRRGPSGGTKARSWAWWRTRSCVAAKRRHGSKVLGVVVSARRRSVVAVTLCGGGTVGVTQVDEDGPGPVSAEGRPEGASRRLLSACC